MNPSKEVPVIVCACDNRYVMPLTVMLNSMIAHLKKYDHVIVYILDNNIHEMYKSLLRESLDPARIVIKWVSINSGEFDGFKTSCYHSASVYARLLIPRLLPDAIGKVIYLDSDMVVQEDIAGLWDTDMGDIHLAAVPEMYPALTYVSSPLGLKRYRELNIPAKNKFFNSGVLVLNVAKWREDGIADRIMHYLRCNVRDVLWHDQDGMNAVLFDKWRELDPRWNVESVVYDRSAWQESPIPSETFMKLGASAFIIHFTGFKKPWHSDCDHPKKRLFMEYFNETLWSHANAPRLMGTRLAGPLKRFIQRRMFHFSLTVRAVMYHVRRFVASCTGCRTKRLQ